MGDLTVFSKRLKEARLKAGYTQAELAKSAHTTPATVSAYENAGTIKKASLDLVINLAEALNVSLDWICGVDNNLKKQTDLDDESKFLAIKTFMNIINCKAEPTFYGNGYFTLEIDDIGVAYYIQEYKRICEVIENVTDEDLKEKATILFLKDFDKSYTEKMHFVNNRLFFKDEYKLDIVQFSSDNNSKIRTIEYQEDNSDLEVPF